MEVFRGYYFIIYVLSSFVETASVQQGIQLNKTHVVHNYTQSFGNHSAFSVRHKRQIFQVGQNNFPCCDMDFVKRHIRRGNCNGVLNNAGHQLLGGFKRELRETADFWPDFPKNGDRKVHSFLVHHNANYMGISNKLRFAIFHGGNYQRRGKYFWLVDIPVKNLGGLRVIQLTGINWKINVNNQNKWTTDNTCGCACGTVGITLGFTKINNVRKITHFHGIWNDMIVDVPNCA